MGSAMVTAMVDSLDPGEVRFFAGGSNAPLAADIATLLGVPLENVGITKFSNDNLYIQLGASVRSREVFIVQSLSPPVNDHLMELLMMLDIARSAGAKAVHALIPYFSFARSDKKDAPRICITARLVADLLETAGATHVMTMVLHSPQVHGFFGVPTDPLSSRHVFSRHFTSSKAGLANTIVIAPDLGHAKSAARFAKELGLPVAAGNKERISDTKVEVTSIVGPTLSDFECAIVYDDEIATGGSVIELCARLVSDGIRRIRVACTHGVFVRQALERIAALDAVVEIVTTDTVFLTPERRHPKLQVLSAAPSFADAIRRNYYKQSIGHLVVCGDGDVA
jgi:ribose-phosphate pyrophosphokinase